MLLATWAPKNFIAGQERAVLYVPVKLRLIEEVLNWRIIRRGWLSHDEVKLRDED